MRTDEMLKILNRFGTVRIVEDYSYEGKHTVQSWVLNEFGACRANSYGDTRSDAIRKLYFFYREIVWDHCHKV